MTKAMCEQNVKQVKNLPGIPPFMWQIWFCSSRFPSCFAGKWSSGYNMCVQATWWPQPRVSSKKRECVAGVQFSCAKTWSPITDNRNKRRWNNSPGCLLPSKFSNTQLSRCFSWSDKGVSRNFWRRRYVLCKEPASKISKSIWQQI